MGDIIAGLFLIILTFVLFGLYRIFTRKSLNKKSLTGFLSLLLVIGSIIGQLITYFNKQSQIENYPISFKLIFLFFLTQTFASIIYFKFPKFGRLLLTITLLLQIPIIHSLHCSYHNQTLFSFNVNNLPRKTFDLEPGSYVHYIYIAPEKLNNTFSLGVNLVPILIIFIYWSKGHNN